MASILVAEDDKSTQKLVCKYLTDIGHNVYISPNGRHAYETLMTNNSFDLLVTDIKMPEMDGCQLIEALRGDPKYADFPIIIMSAQVSVKEISNLLKLGASVFQAKPLNRELLYNNVKLSLGT